MSRIDAFLELAVKQGGSDLHLVSGQAPRIRLNGVLHRVRFRELSVEDLTRVLDEIMEPRLREQFREHGSVDFAYQVPGLGRFRANVYRHARGIAAALRIVPEKVRRLDDLGLPPSVKAAVSQPKGLTLVTGPTGSGKSTTLAAMVDHINETRRGHIITIEDPIEFVHQAKKCSVTQREIGTHSPTFAEALRNAVRADPDVIMVGEVRDMETVSLALTAAETGVQVMTTLHTNGAARSVDRIVNVFPARRQDQVRTMLAESLRLIVSQQLLRTADGSARVLAAEVLVNTPAASSVIRSGQSHKLESVIQAGKRMGMQSLDGRLRELLREEVITEEEASEHAVDRSKFGRRAA